MRIIGEIDNEKYCHAFSQFLSQKGILHQIEIVRNVDWGSPDYGSVKGLIWIHDEDQVSEAEKYLAQFKENPQDPLFNNLISTPSWVTPSHSTDQNEPESVEKSPPPMSNRAGFYRESQRPLGPITRFIIIACCLLFFASNVFISKEAAQDKSIPLLFSSPVEKKGLYDFPYTYQLVERALNLYGYESLENPESLPPEGQKLIKQIDHTPFWQGFYHLLLLKNTEDIVKQVKRTPMFEKIREGEVWRLITPCFLHADLFHLFFNMLWLFVLGKQIESRLGIFKYIILILILGIFSNTFQYLMSGPNFIGFSGILCGMLTFVWMRQKSAPWEGYQLDKATIVFMLLFIFGMAALQFFSFFLEKVADLTISPGLANMAHISGAFLGVILGKLNFFSWRST